MQVRFVGAEVGGGGRVPVRPGYKALTQDTERIHNFAALELPVDRNEAIDEAVKRVSPRPKASTNDSRKHRGPWAVLNDAPVLDH